MMLDSYLYNSFFGALTRARKPAAAPPRHHATTHLPAADMNDAGMGVKFVRACCDKILELVEYRDNACPHFLFYMVCALTGLHRRGGAECDGRRSVALRLRASDASVSMA